MKHVQEKTHKWQHSSFYLWNVTALFSCILYFRTHIMLEIGVQNFYMSCRHLFQNK